MKRALFSLFCLIFLSGNLFADEVVGFWKTIDENSGKPQSVIGIYKHGDKYYGRIILTYDDEGNVQDTIYKPAKRAPGVVGHPYYAGLDIIWDLKDKNSTYSGGHIMDPQEGKIYDAKMWKDGNNLIVRGEILFFGRNQAWPPAAEHDFPAGFEKPDLSNLTPAIPEVID